MRVLIVEDHKDINEMLVSLLKEHGYETISAYDGRQARVMLKDENYDLVLMDLMLPYLGGGDLIKELRTYSDVPVIVLSAKSMIETRLEVLKLGADDYILKPFNLDEVLVRMEVVLRRSMMRKEENEKENQKPLTLGALCLYRSEQRLEYEGKTIALTSKELHIFTLMMENPMKTFSKANLYETVWENTYYAEDNTINVHMSNLRSKLKKATGKDYIETVWGIGYRLKGEE